MTKPATDGIAQRATAVRSASGSTTTARPLRRASQGPITSEYTNRPPAMSPTSTKKSPQRVSRTSSLRMFWTVLKPINGNRRPNARRPVKRASRSARPISGPANFCAASGISDLFDIGPAEDALWQEDHGDGENREGGDVLIGAGDVFGPQRFDHADQESSEHGAR